MKDLDFMTLIAGIVVCAVIGLIMLLLLGDLTFAGMCIIAAAILYAASLR